MIDTMIGCKTPPPATAAEVADWLVKAKAAAKDSDLVIAVLGESASMSGEGASRATLGSARHAAADARGRIRCRQAGGAGVGEWPPARYSLGGRACSRDP